MFRLFLPVLLLSLHNAHAQLERTFQTHGGLPAWQTYRTVEFDLDWKSPKRSQLDHQTFDLQTRDGLIKGEKYLLGADHGEVWITPGPDALGGTPPRFYMWTPFYFFAMPFVFGDPGAQFEPLGTRSVGGVDYDAVKITFKAGTGDSPEDFYIAHLDKNSGQLKIVAYVVTYPALRKNKTIAELEMHALVFDEWQTANNLSVPKTAHFFVWKNDSIEGDPIGTMQFSGVHFSAEPARADHFKKPNGAVVAPLQ